MSECPKIMYRYRKWQCITAISIKRIFLHTFPSIILATDGVFLFASIRVIEMYSLLSLHQRLMDTQLKDVPAQMSGASKFRVQFLKVFFLQPS